MVEVVGDSLLTFWRGRVIALVKEYSDRGFSFGYPACPEKRYTEPNQLPDPVHVKGPGIGKHVQDISRKLNVRFGEPDCYGHYEGHTLLKNTNDIQIKVAIELWDTDFPFVTD
ncbi:MAG: hypothetical protein HY512_00255 [Candidatus Aenigmarchaeota archaeon]|nr:hypothetical protein [Candidatus Aenigmarchaeota archaeon]